MADIESLFKAAAPPERSVPVCLRGDLQARHEELSRELQVAGKQDAESFEGGNARRVADQIKALEAEMRESTVTFLLRALGQGKPFKLQCEHPPRDGDEFPGDKVAGVNESTYYLALVRATCAEVVHHNGTRVPQEDISDDAWQAMFDALSNKQFDDLVGTAQSVSLREVGVPFSQLASVISQRSEPDSKTPRRGTPRRSASKAGSPKSSPSTSTTTPEGSSAP